MIKCWFDYKTVIVTGASSGIGKGLTEKLVKEHNCRVIGIARNEGRLSALKESLGNKKDWFSYYAFDTSKKENWDSFSEILSKENIYPDILINSAGVLPKFNRFLDYSLEEIEKTMQINYFSCVYSMHTLIPILLKSDSAAIITLSSALALSPFSGTSIYSASKSAIKSLADSVREELRGNCYVGLVCPGFVKTNIFRNQGSRDFHSSEKAIEFICSDCDRIVNLIIKGIWKKKEFMVFGVDGHLANMGKFLPGTLCSRIGSAVEKISGINIFQDVFKN